MARGTNQSSKHKGMSYTKFGYLFIAPFVIVYCLFSLYPLLTTFWYSGTVMQSTQSAFWGFSNREVYYDRYLDLTKIYSSFDGGLEGQTGINTTDYKNMQAYFQAQNKADQYDPIDPEALQYIVDNGDISDATRGKVQQVIDTGDISYLASDADAVSELIDWTANYVDLGITIINSLSKVNNAAITAATVEESESESAEDAITAEDILTGDNYAAFLDTLQNGEFDEGQTLLMNYLANYAGVDSLYDFFAAEDVSVESDVFYYICANLDSPNAVYTSADGETSVAAVTVPFMADLTTYLNANVWSTTVPAINSYSEFQSYIDGEKELHADEEQLYSDLATLDGMGLIVSQVQLVQEGDTLVQSSNVTNNVLVAMRQYIDSNYQSDSVKTNSVLAINCLRNYLEDQGRTRLVDAGFDVDSYITFNGEFDVNRYLEFKSLIGLSDQLTMARYEELDQQMQDFYVEQARANLETAQGKLPDAQAAYDAAVATGDDAQINSANEALSRVKSDISNAESTISRPSGILEKADSSTQYLFVGMKNFGEIFGNKYRFNVVAGAFYTTAVMWVIGFIPQILLALLLSAWFTDTKLKLKGLSVMKALMYLPNVITAATIAIFFRRLFSYSTGSATSAVQMFLDAVGHERINFFINPWATRLIVCFINFWMWYGNTMIVLIAGITSISESLYESAQLDGANSFQTYTKITMPLLRPILLYTLVTSMIGGLQMYDIPFNLNQYPSLVAFNGTYIKCTQTVLMYVNQLAFGKSSIKQVGIASAVSVILFIVTTILSILIFFLMRDKDAAAAAKAKKLARKAGR